MTPEAPSNKTEMLSNAQQSASKSTGNQTNTEAPATREPEWYVSDGQKATVHYGDCLHCDSSWLLDPEGRVPAHADPTSRHTGLTRQACPGSRQKPTMRAEG